MDTMTYTTENFVFSDGWVTVTKGSSVRTIRLTAIESVSRRWYSEDQEWDITVKTVGGSKYTWGFKGAVDDAAVLALVRRLTV